MNPGIYGPTLAQAQDFYSRGNLVQAQTLCRQILASDPRHVPALSLLAWVLQKSGQWAQAELAIRQLLVLQPYEGAGYAMLGDLLLKMGRSSDAVVAWRQATLLFMPDPSLHARLGATLAELGRDDEAIAELRAAQRGPRVDEGSTGLLATLLHRHGRFDELRLLLGNAVFLQSKTGDPRALVEFWHQLLPDDAVPRYHLAAWSGEDAPTRADDAYVTYLFDRYAHSFDRTLAGLGYQAPALIAAQIGVTLGPPTGQWQVLDAGCGTGLCGPLLRPYASLLTGVDLSPGMVAKARERDCYDVLVEGELTAVLNDLPDSQDLIVSADTLVYFGDLTQALASITRALRPAGWVAFSLEQAPDSVMPQGYHLNATGRYIHAAAYVCQTVAGAGLRLEVMDTVTLRMNDGEPVVGFRVLAQRPFMVRSGSETRSVSSI